jgi:hypothetical protein
MVAKRRLREGLQWRRGRVGEEQEEVERAIDGKRGIFSGSSRGPFAGAWAGLRCALQRPLLSTQHELGSSTAGLLGLMLSILHYGRMDHRLSSPIRLPGLTPAAPRVEAAAGSVLASLCPFVAAVGGGEASMCALPEDWQAGRGRNNRSRKTLPSSISAQTVAGEHPTAAGIRAENKKQAF